MTARLIPTSDAARLTSLPVATFREWTVRRALIAPDVPPAGKGSSARFAWQTVLVLRIAALLKDRLHIDLQAHRSSFAALRALLGRTSFVKLWGCRLRHELGGGWSLIGPSDEAGTDDAIVLALDLHLVVLRDGFALSGQPGPEQLDLFPISTLHGRLTRTRVRDSTVRQLA